MYDQAISATLKIISIELGAIIGVLIVILYALSHRD